MFSYSFLKLRLNYYQSELEKLPKGYVGFNSSKNKDVVRLYYEKGGTKKKSEYYIDRVEGIKALELLSKRDNLEMLINKYISEITAVCKEQIKSISGHITGVNTVSKLPASYFEKAKITCKREEDKSPEEYPYTFEGIRMRSRAEQLVAEVIKSRDFQFIYEPKLEIGGIIYYPDFLVYVPELNCCFFIEYFGMMDKASYASRCGNKIGDYSLVGLKPDVDVLFIYGTEKNLPDPILIGNLIDSLVNYISSTID